METAAAFDLLKYGPIGLIAFALVLVGFTVWRYFKLAGDAGLTSGRFAAAPNAVWAMIGCAVAAMAFAFYLADREYDDKKVRKATLLIDPWDAPDARRYPAVFVGDKARGDERPFAVVCEAGQPASVRINLKPYIDYRIEQTLAERQRAAPPQVDEPEI